MKQGCLIIDMQVGVCDAQAYHLFETITQIQTLRTWCHEQGIEVIYVRHDDQSAPITKGDKAWEIIPALAPVGNAKIIDKFYNSAFYQTDLDVYLKEHQIDTLYIVGMQSEYCIDATIKSAFEKGYRVILPQGCTTTVDQTNISASTLCTFYEQSIWNHRFGEVLPLSEIMK